MSTASFRLFKKGSRWHARSRAGGKEIEFSCGTADKAAASKYATAELARRRAPPAAAPAKRRPGRPLGSKTKAPAPPEPTAPPSSPPAAPAPVPSDNRAKAIADKLRALAPMSSSAPSSSPAPAAAPAAPGPSWPKYTGPSFPDDDDDDAGGGDDKQDDKQPLQPDDVIPPAAAAGDEKEEGEEEADELFADTVATAVVTGTVGVITRSLRDRSPPMRPGEPNEKAIDWYRDGLAYRLRKMMGARSIGPTTKMVLGATGVILSMLIGAEEIHAQPYSTPAPAPRSPPPAAPADVDDEVRPARNGVDNAIGRFRG